MINIVIIITLFLVQHGEDWTALMFAVINNKPESCKLLIDAGASLDLKYDVCTSALSNVCYARYARFIHLLCVLRSFYIYTCCLSRKVRQHWIMHEKKVTLRS